MAETTYQVPAVHCGHCVHAITEEVSRVPGIEKVLVDLAAKTVTVNGDAYDDAAVRAAIDEAGYDIADDQSAAGRTNLPLL